MCGKHLDNTEKKMRCRKCIYFDYDLLDDKPEQTTEHFCGLHGRARVDPDGKQMNLNSHGSCGFSPNQPKAIQLTFLNDLIS